jgi:hypothetical protein
METPKFFSKQEIEAVYAVVAEIRLPRLGVRRRLGQMLIAIGASLAQQRVTLSQPVESPQIASEGP